MPCSSILKSFDSYVSFFQKSGINSSVLPFLECFAETVLAQFILEQGIIARDKLKEVDTESADGIFYRGKIETAKFFCRNILPNVFARHTVVQQEDTSALDIPEEAF